MYIIISVGYFPEFCDPSLYAHTNMGRRDDLITMFSNHLSPEARGRHDLLSTAQLEDLADSLNLTGFIGVKPVQVHHDNTPPPSSDDDSDDDDDYEPVQEPVVPVVPVPQVPQVQEPVPARRGGPVSSGVRAVVLVRADLDRLMKSLLRAMEKHGIDGYEKRWTVAWPQVFGRAQEAIKSASGTGDAETISAIISAFEDEAVDAFDEACAIVLGD